MNIATNGEAQLAWDSQGKGEPLLLIMGHRFPRHMWFRTTPVLSKHFRVITFDNRGVGDTNVTKKPYTMRDQAADAIAVLDAAGIESAHVYGISMGGAISQQLVLDHPDRVRSLVLGCTAIPSQLKVMPRPKIPLGAIFGGAKGRAAFAIKILYGSVAKKHLIEQDMARLAHQPITMRGTRGQRHAMLKATITAADLAAISVPTLVLHGDEDVIVPYSFGKAVADSIPDAKLVTYPGAGHMYPTDYEEQANTDVLEFLQGLSPRAEAKPAAKAPAAKKAPAKKAPAVKAAAKAPAKKAPAAKKTTKAVK